MKKIAQYIKIVTLVAVLTVGVYYTNAWTNPTSNPPDGNVTTPLNVSSVAQTKSGSLTVGGLSLPSSGTINDVGRLHIQSGENLYLNPWGGNDVVVGGGGGNGHLTVAGSMNTGVNILAGGNITAGGNVTASNAVTTGGGMVMNGNQLYNPSQELYLNYNGVGNTYIGSPSGTAYLQGYARGATFGFGGLFSVIPQIGCFGGNPYSGGCGCPAGFSPSLYASFNVARNVDIYLYQCVR